MKASGCSDGTMHIRGFVGFRIVFSAGGFFRNSRLVGVTDKRSLSLGFVNVSIWGGVGVTVPEVTPPLKAHLQSSELCGLRCCEGVGMEVLRTSSAILVLVFAERVPHPQQLKLDTLH